MKKLFLCLFAVLALGANAAQTMRVCEPTKPAAEPSAAPGLRAVGEPVNYSALCGNANFHCKDVARNNFDQPDAHCFVITAKHGQIPQPQDLGHPALSVHNPREPQLVPVK